MTSPPMVLRSTSTEGLRNQIEAAERERGSGEALRQGLRLCGLFHVKEVAPPASNMWSSPRTAPASGETMSLSQDHHQSHVRHPSRFFRSLFFADASLLATQSIQQAAVRTRSLRQHHYVQLTFARPASRSQITPAHHAAPSTLHSSTQLPCHSLHRASYQTTLSSQTSQPRSATAGQEQFLIRTVSKGWYPNSPPALRPPPMATSFRPPSLTPSFTTHAPHFHLARVLFDT